MASVTLTGTVGVRRSGSIVNVVLGGFIVFVLLEGLIALNCGRWPTALLLVKYTDEAFVLVAFCATLWSQHSWEIGARKLRKEALLLGGFVGVGIISSLISHVSLTIWASQLLLHVKGYLFFYVVATRPFDGRTLRKCSRLVGYCAMLFLGVGLIDALAPAALRAFLGNTDYGDSRAGIISVKSLFTHPGDFGWFTALLAACYLAFAMVRRDVRCLAVGIIASVFCLLSMRAKSVGGLAVSTVVAILAHPRIGRAGSIALLVGVGTVFCLLFLPQIEELSALTADRYLLHPEPLTVARSALYLVSIEIARDYFPLGAGFGRYGSWIAREHYSGLYHEYGLSNVYGLQEGDGGAESQFACDAQWPMVLGESGVLGFLCYLAMLIVIAVSLLRHFQREGDPSIKAVHLAALMVMTQALVASIAQPVFTRGPLTYLVLGMAGVSYALTQNADASGPRSTTRSNDTGSLGKRVPLSQRGRSNLHAPERLTTFAKGPPDSLLAYGTSSEPSP